jgi:hypothetical protein
MKEIKTNFESQHTSVCRFAPMGLIRCSRGGKTFALQHIARHCKKWLGDDVTVIYISFADVLFIRESEQENPLSALLHRIVFSAYEYKTHLPISLNFVTVRSQNMTVPQLVHWLGDTKCILLITANYCSLLLTLLLMNCLSF